MRDPYRQVGERVRVTRKRVRLTQAQLAQKADLSENFIGLIERGEGHPTLETLDKIARALGGHLGELFSGGEEMPKERAIKELAFLLTHRDSRDANLVLSIARKVFDRYPANPRRSG